MRKPTLGEVIGGVTLLLTVLWGIASAGERIGTMEHRLLTLEAALRNCQ